MLTIDKGKNKVFAVAHRALALAAMGVVSLAASPAGTLVQLR